MPVARTGESDEPSSRRPGGKLLLVAGVITALGAAGVLVLSDDLRWLRLGVVAGLWAALVGAFIAARYRGKLADREDRAADLQAVYELELEREIAARREYELQVEAEIRAEVDEQSRRDVAALRDELRTLRQTLENLLGGEVLVERYALQAQATRMRPLQEAQVKRLPAAVNGPMHEPVTEQFDRVTELRPVKTGPRAVPPLPRRADRPERPPWPSRDPAPPQQATGPHPVDSPDPRVAELPPTVVSQFRPTTAERPVPRQADRSQRQSADDFRPPSAAPPAPRVDRRPPPAEPPPMPDRFGPPTAEQPLPPTGTGYRPATGERPLPPELEIQRIRSLAEQSLSRIEALRPRPADPPSHEEFRPATPRVEQPRRDRVEPPSGAGFRPAAAADRRAPVEPPSGTGFRPAAPRRDRVEPQSGARFRPEPPLPPSEPVRTAWEERPVAPPPAAQESGRWPARASEQSRSGRHSEPPATGGGRRRRAEPEPPARRHARPDEEAGGRRRRAEETPSWQELAAWDPVVKATSRARPPEDRGQPRAGEGSHATGHSVADLLAQHGSDNPRRRRRRQE